MAENRPCIKCGSLVYVNDIKGCIICGYKPNKLHEYMHAEEQEIEEDKHEPNTNNNN